MIKNYRYFVRLEKAELGANEELSNIFWQQAKTMNALWNQMVETRIAFLESVQPLYQDKVSNREQLKLRWKEFDKSLAEITRESSWKEKLGWEAREAVLERFRTASSRALKDGGELRLKPKRVTQISFYHRFSAGGLETPKIFAGKSKKLSLSKLPDQLYDTESHQNRHRRYSPGVFGIGLGDQPLRISVYLHRPIPRGKLKTAQFVGKFDEMRRAWEWTLVLAIDTAETAEMATYKPVAALDLNWRRREDYLRIGFLRDTAAGEFEIRLPLISPPSRRARNLLKSRNTYLQHHHLPLVEFRDLFPQNVLEIVDWQARADELKDAVKNQIKTVYEKLEQESRPEHAREFLQFYTKIGRRGLFKLLWRISEAEEILPEDIEVREIIETWKPKDHRLRLSIHQTYKYLTNKRKKLYENIALWLKKTYSHLIWEGDLSLKEMGEAAPKISLNSKEVAIKLGNKFRQYAGLSVLRGKIKEHNIDKKWLIGAKAANTTRRCRVCKEMCEPTAALMLQCPQGHVFDQDSNSCSNMLDVIPDDLIYSTKKESVAVPEHLREFIVPFVVERH